MTPFMRLTTVLSLLVLVALHLPLQAESPKIAPPRLDVRVSANGLTATSSSATLMLQIAGPNGFQVKQHSTDGSLNWYNPGNLIDGHYRYDVYATPNIQRDDLTRAELKAIPTTRQSGRFRLEQGRLIPEADPLGRTSRLPGRTTLWATLWEQLIPSAAAQNLTASGVEPAVIWDDTDEGDEFDWLVFGTNNSGTSNDFWGLLDSTDGTETLPLNIKGGDTNANSLVVDALGDLTLANGALFIDRSTGNVNIGSTTETCCNLFVGGDSFPEVGLKSTEIGASLWELEANNGGFLIRENASSGAFDIINGAPPQSLRIASNGFIGMGTPTPDASLHVREDAAGFPQLFHLENAGSDFAGFRFTTTGGSIDFNKAGGNTFRLNVVDGDTWELQLDPAGDLTIKGSLTTASNTLPDYVFEPEYPLMPLKELAAYVAKEKHLPKIPSQADVDETGQINMSALQLGLLEKVEELFLHSIAQQTELETVRQEHTVELENLRQENRALQQANATEMAALTNELAGVKQFVQQLAAKDQVAALTPRP